VKPKILYSPLILKEPILKTLRDSFKDCVKFVDVKNLEGITAASQYTTAFLDLRNAVKLANSIDLRIKPEGIYDYATQALIFGKELFLNYDFYILPAYLLEEKTETPVFCKPVDLIKKFGGQIIKDKIDAKGLLLTTATTPDTKLILSTVKPIKLGSETRFFVNNGRIVHYSGYSPENAEVDKDIIKFAKSVIPSDNCMDERLRLFNLGRYTLDVCQLETGEFKVVEINCFHTSGFYLCDPVAIVLECFKGTANFNGFIKVLKETRPDVLEWYGKV